MIHRYVVGDDVRLAFGFFDRDAVSTYVVTRLLPAAVDGELQNRIIGQDCRERVIGEGQIARDGLAGHHAPRTVIDPIAEIVARINGAPSNAPKRKRGTQKGDCMQQEPTS